MNRMLILIYYLVVWSFKYSSVFLLLWMLCLYFACLHFQHFQYIPIFIDVWFIHTFIYIDHRDFILTFLLSSGFRNCDDLTYASILRETDMCLNLIAASIMTYPVKDLHIHLIHGIYWLAVALPLMLKYYIVFVAAFMFNQSLFFLSTCSLLKWKPEGERAHQFTDVCVFFAHPWVCPEQHFVSFTDSSRLGTIWLSCMKVIWSIFGQQSSIWGARCPASTCCEYLVKNLD